jgi:MtfA peptidase
VSWSLARWRRERILKRAPIDTAVWSRTLTRYGFLVGLAQDELDRLRETTTLFLHAKQIHAAGGLELTAEMRVAIAVQACILVLNLPLEWYDGWVEIIVYPEEFIPEVEWVDEIGVVHKAREIRAGEAWLQGPVILSWADIAHDYADGVNVAIHEFAHKLDMLNGEADGFPPLHPDMSRAHWTRIFTAAFDSFRGRVGRGEPTDIDPYAGESPAEFFAVLSEAFFELPETVLLAYPDVYEQLRKFYRQDPYQRQVTAGVIHQS